MGDGANTLFWDDVWCGSRSLKVQFPRIYMLDDKMCKVSDRLRPLEWFSVFRRPPRGGVETLRFAGLREFINLVRFYSDLDTWT